MRNRGHELLQERARGGDYEAAAALVVLESSAFAGDQRAWRHVDTDGIDWEAILDDGTWSSGERRLLELGRALWAGRGTVDAAYLFTSLSRGFEQVVIDAITARRGYQPLPAPKVLAGAR